jgi:esterase/lipase superfamily enzyme
MLSTAGCVTNSPLACPQQTGPRTAHVLFATDRKQLDPAKKDTAPKSLDFGPGRTSPPALQLGWQDVRIGPRHHRGLLDAAVTLAPAEVQARPGQTFPKQALQHTDAEIDAYVTKTVRAAIRASPPPSGGGRREVLLYVHGYNDTFDYCVKKTAQLAADLDMVNCEGQSRGVAIAYSWPAQGTFLSYLADEENVEWTQQRMVPFLRALSSVARAEGADLHVIAHSMGARLVIRSLASMSAANCPGPNGHIVDQVILLAPDIARELFSQYIDRVLPLVNHVTIYVNSKDRALALSSLVHGGHHRLGLIESTLSTALNLTGLTSDDPRDLTVSEQAGASGKIDMVDVTGALTDFTGHSYEDPAFVHDLSELFYHHTPAGTGGRSNLQPKQVRPELFGLLGEKIHYYRLPKGS